MILALRTRSFYTRQVLAAALLLAVLGLGVYGPPIHAVGATRG